MVEYIIETLIFQKNLMANVKPLYLYPTILYSTNSKYSIFISCFSNIYLK